MINEWSCNERKAGKLTIRCRQNVMLHLYIWHPAQPTHLHSVQSDCQSCRWPPWVRTRSVSRWPGWWSRRHCVWPCSPSPAAVAAGWPPPWRWGCWVGWPEARRHWQLGCWWRSWGGRGWLPGDGASDPVTWFVTMPLVRRVQHNNTNYTQKMITLTLTLQKNDNDKDE